MWKSNKTLSWEVTKDFFFLQQDIILETLTFLKDIFSDNFHFKNNSIQLNIKFIYIAGFIWLQLQLELWTDRRLYSVVLMSLFFFFSTIFYRGKINSIRFAILSVQFSSIKYIHIFLQPSALSNSRTFSSSPVKTLFPLNKHSISSLPTMCKHHSIFHLWIWLLYLSGICIDIWFHSVLEKVEGPMKEWLIGFYPRRAAILPLYLVSLSIIFSFVPRHRSITLFYN